MNRMDDFSPRGSELAGQGPCDALDPTQQQARDKSRRRTGGLLMRQAMIIYIYIYI